MKFISLSTLGLGLLCLTPTALTRAVFPHGTKADIASVQTVTTVTGVTTSTLYSSKHLLSSATLVPGETSLLTTTVATPLPDAERNLDTSVPDNVVTTVWVTEVTGTVTIDQNGQTINDLSVSTIESTVFTTAFVPRLDLTTFSLVSTPSLTSPPNPSSTFDLGQCDELFCQDGKSICIYWVGYTSWDVSLGPMPGEQPTVIGTC
ncbi:hypothetical protein F5Y15DRAFT_258018 [Xylariaceae sp. FL0016]|nr:hypothetical protein F5Y15DRAFT_258018 [Xylariaceae sp. FL0016]